MTSKILFRDVLSDAVKPFAFFKSKYPLILSIENHCSLECQEKMAEYLEDILGELLYKGPVHPHEIQLPSPEQMSKKILVKAKKTSLNSSGMKNKVPLSKYCISERQLSQYNLSFLN